MLAILRNSELLKCVNSEGLSKLKLPFSVNMEATLTYITGIKAI